MLPDLIFSLEPDRPNDLKGTLKSSKKDYSPVQHMHQTFKIATLLNATSAVKAATLLDSFLLDEHFRNSQNTRGSSNYYDLG